VTPARRTLAKAFVAAAVWFAVLTSINMGLEQKLRSVLLFALPVAWVGSRSLVAGFVMAGLGTLSALIGGAIPHADSKEPILFEGLFAYLKLSIIALFAFIGDRLVRKGSPGD
jgi:hypothetical protein